MKLGMKSLRSLLTVAAALGGAGAAFGQAAIPFPPIDGVIERPADYEPVPRPRPTLQDHFGTECVRAAPSLAWFSLPPALRRVDFETMAGQLILAGFSGRTAEGEGVIDTREAIARGDIGGVVFFGDNVGSRADVREIADLFRDAHPAFPATIAIDQEGGAVMRVGPDEGAPDTPAARDVAQQSLRSARDEYDAMADALEGLGFTLNFGPVVDLAVNPDNPVVNRYGRSFGEEPDTVLRYARAFVRAHREAGVGTALKHFPGHGSTDDDSHDTPIDLASTWSRTELIPFAEMIRSGDADMIMMGHLTLEGLTGPEGLPASLSPVAIDGFLRDTLCYEGVVVSDDLAMKAITARWGVSDAAIKVVAAGGDLMIVSKSAGDDAGTLSSMRRALVDEAQSSPGFADLLRNAYARVINHKLDLVEARALSGRTHAPQSRQWAGIR